MADSFFDQRRKALGLMPDAPSDAPAPDTGDSSPVPNSNISFFDQRKMDLGLIPDTRTKYGPPDLSTPHTPEEMQQQEHQYDQPPAPQPKPVWNGLLDNPIVNGLENGAKTALNWVQKPFETVSTGLADADAAINNLIGTHQVQDFSGNTLTLTPSQQRNVLNDVGNIWSQTNSPPVSQQAWQGAEPNLGIMPGTNKNWTDVIDFGAQSLGPGELLKPLGAATKYAGSALGDVLSSFFSKSPDAAPLLGLPEPKAAQMAREAEARSVLTPNETPIYGQGQITPLALPPSPRYDELQQIKNSQTLALPEPANMDAVRRSQGTILPTGNEPIPMPGDIYQPPVLGLPEGNYTPPTRLKVSNPGTLDYVLRQIQPEVEARAQGIHANLSDAQAQLDEVNNNLQQLEDGYNQAVQNQFDYLKNLRDQKGGIAQKGGVTYDTEGNVTGSFGAVSNRPLWYQDYTKEINKATPNNSELMTLAKRQVDQGYQDELGAVPSWKQANNYDDTKSALQEVKQQLEQSIGEKVQNGVYDLAVQAAQQRGYDLPALLDNSKNPLHQKMAKDAQKRVYGVYPETLPKVQTPKFNITHENPAAAPLQKTGLKGRPVQKPAIASEPKPTQEFIETPAQRDQRIANTLKLAGDLKRIDELKNPIVGRGPVMRDTVQLKNGIRKPNVRLDKTPVKEEPAAEPMQEAAKTNQAVEAAKQSWFTRLFGPDNGVGVTPFGSGKSGRMVSTEQQIVKNPLKSGVKGLWNGTKQAIRGTYQNTVDFLNPLKNINRETYDTAMDAARANNIANQIIRNKFVDNEGHVIGKSLDDIMKLGRGLGKKIDDYLVLRHAVTRMERGERVYDEQLNMTLDKAKEQLAKMEARYPQLKQFGQEWDQFNENLLNSGVKEGLISQQARDAMRSENPHYASMRRQFTIGEKLAQPKFSGTGSAFSGQRAPIKEVSPTGSTRKIVSPIRSAVEQVYAWKNAELRNRTMQEVVKAIQQDPEGMKGIAEIVKKPSTSYKSLDEALREGGSDEFLQQLDGDFKSLFQQHKSGEENVVRAMVKGQPVFVKVHDPEAVKALLGMGHEQSGIILGALQKLSNATKRGATGFLAPMFAVKNLTADTVQAAIQSPNALRHVAIDLPHAIISSIGEVLHIPGLRNLAEEYKQAGGEYSALLRGDRPLNNAVYNLRKEAPLSAKGLAKGTWSAVKLPFKALEKVSDITENANRMAAYRRALVGKEHTAENVRNAVNAARESTTNFSRKGHYANETEAFIPYSNAAVQGLYRIIKAFYKNPIKTTAGVLALVIAPKLMEYAKFNNDPDYQKITARDRYRNLIVHKNADGTFTQLPMPPEYEAFGALLNATLDHAMKKDPQAFKGTLDALANAWTPPVLSGALQGVTQGGGLEQSIKGVLNATTLAPAVAIAGNQSFTGAPIVPQKLQNNSVPMQSNEQTSRFANFLGKELNMAPLKVDYLLRAYGGDPARLLLPLNSPVGGGAVRNTLMKNFIVDPVMSNNLSNNFYEAKNAYAAAENDKKDFGASLPSWYDKHMANTLNSQAAGSVNQKISKLSNQKRTVQTDKTLSPQEKADKIRSIQSQINNIYLDVNSKLQQSGYQFSNR